MRIIALCIIFSACSNEHKEFNSESKYTNSPTMGDAARASGEKPF